MLGIKSFPFGALCMFSGAFWLVLVSVNLFRSKLLAARGVFVGGGGGNV